jgi:UDP-N-acetylmuramate--alanine ligase
MELSKIKKIYMIGIKGVGMTMLAQFFAVNGVEVVGSDTEEKFMTDEVLKKNKIKVIEGFNDKNIPKDADLIIYSSAYNAENNIEIKCALGCKCCTAQRHGIKVLSYAQALGEVFNQKYGIAVVGSHGKTTTSAWLGFVMREAGMNPNVMVGASVPQFDGAALISSSDYLVIEADEYQNKFTNLQPKAVVLNNIDYDHPDFFKDEDEYKKVFIELIKKIPQKGFLVANYDDPVIRKIAQVNCKAKVITYAIDEAADYVAYDIKQQGSMQYFKVKLGVDEMDVADSTGSFGYAQDDNGELGDFSIGLIGKHNISNALAVIATCIELGVDLVDIRKYLEEFKGTARRMQIMGTFKGATIIDDYAHHPTEIKTTLEGARQIHGNKKIISVFHPHTFTRTKALLDDFAKSFGDADEVIVLDIYGSAREEHGGVSSEDLVRKVKSQKSPAAHRTAGQAKVKVSYIPTLKECEEYLRENVERGDVVILMGAGDVFRIGENLIK